MSKIAIVYWSGTGNTEAMANLVAEGVAAAGGQANLLTPSCLMPGRWTSTPPLPSAAPLWGRNS